MHSRKYSGLFFKRSRNVAVIYLLGAVQMLKAVVLAQVAVKDRVEVVVDVLVTVLVP